MENSNELNKGQNRNYSEQKDARRFIVLTLDSEILGIWVSLKKICIEMKETDADFPSYWTLARKKENPIKFKTQKGDYTISVEKPK